MVPRVVWPSPALPGLTLGRGGPGFVPGEEGPSARGGGGQGGRGYRPGTGPRGTQGGRAQAFHLGTSGSGQKPSQKETLTAAWVVQPRSRRTMVFTRTWQESEQRKGSGRGSGGGAPWGRVRGRRLGGAQGQEGGLTHFLTGVAAALFPEDALGKGSEGKLNRWGLGRPGVGRGGGLPGGRIWAPGWAGPPGVGGGGRGLRGGACGRASRSPDTHPAAGHVWTDGGCGRQHREPFLDLAAVLRAVVHEAVEPRLVELKSQGESGGQVGGHGVGGGAEGEGLLPGPAGHPARCKPSARSPHSTCPPRWNTRSPGGGGWSRAHPGSPALLLSHLQARGPGPP